ncbi:hypothetical protein VTO42DRAFT_3764 [Malbranchea cinnamomea]
MWRWQRISWGWERLGDASSVQVGSAVRSWTRGHHRQKDHDTCRAAQSQFDQALVGRMDFVMYISCSTENAPPGRWKLCTILPTSVADAEPLAMSPEDPIEKNILGTGF